MNDLWLFVTKNNLERVLNPRDSTINNVPQAVEILLRDFDGSASVLDTTRAVALISLLSGVTMRRNVKHIDANRIVWSQILEQTKYPHQFAATLLSALWANMTDIEDVHQSKAWEILVAWLAVEDSLLLESGSTFCLRDDASIMYSLSERMFGAHWHEIVGLGTSVSWERMLVNISRHKPAFMAGIERGPTVAVPLPLPDIDIGPSP
jgi:hypothetical protein